MSLLKFIFASDPHGDQIEPSVFCKLLDFTGIFKPHLKVLGGDLFDFRPLRRGASAEERSESMRADFEAGMRFLKLWKPDVFLDGNHDARLPELAMAGKGVESDYAAQGVQQINALCSKLKCKRLPYHKRDGVYRVGHLKMLHGFYCGVNAAKQHGQTYGSCLFGHVHTIDEASVPGLERRTARAVGALCKLDMPYNARQPNTLRQAHGWAYGIVNEKTGNYWVQQAEEIDGVWMLPSEFRQL